MGRADTMMNKYNVLVHVRLRARALGPWAAAGLLVGAVPAAWAQTQPPPGTPADVRYTAPTAGDATLLPRAPGLDADKLLLFRGEQSGIDYAASGIVARIVVEVDRNAVPADGQSPVKLSGAPVRG